MNLQHNIKIRAASVAAYPVAATKTLLPVVLSPSIRPSDDSRPTGKAAQGVSKEVHTYINAPHQ
jgi:hypothetical protein